MQNFSTLRLTKEEIRIKIIPLYYCYIEYLFRTHLNGLVGWWRRLEILQTKQEEKDRKMKEKLTKASVAKLSCVSNFFPQTINTHSVGKTTPTKRKYFSNSGSRKLHCIFVWRCWPHNTDICITTLWILWSAHTKRVLVSSVK
jgi:hypothetical protein